ncbi:MAG: MFS transporter [Vampirovibrionales bacterium]|nr:MFS transporter [Vampirovibrionales bacterium]
MAGVANTLTLDSASELSDVSGVATSSECMGLPHLLMLAVGITGFQFAWSTQIALSSRVLEPLGADPFLFGLIWCAGPITGIFVQPLVGLMSDHTKSPLGKRWPYILAGAILGSLAMWGFPYAPNLLVATLLIWIIDACVNTAQGPYRALVPDLVPRAQQAIANSYMNFGIGAGNVVAMGFAPLVLALLDTAISIPQQYLISAIVMGGITFLTAAFIREKSPQMPSVSSTPSAADNHQESAAKPSVIVMLKSFAAASPEIHKISAVQFCTWLALMGMFIYLTPYITHHVFRVPDMTDLSHFTNAQIAGFKALQTQATNTAQSAFAVFNLVCLVLSLPLGYLTIKLGKKNVLSVALLIMALGFLTAPFLTSAPQVVGMLACAGVAWATILSIPFAILCDHMPKGQEGSIMGMFNVFVCLPQLIAAIAVGWWINQWRVPLPVGFTHAWWLPFVVGAVSLLVGVVVLQQIQEVKPARG